MSRGLFNYHELTIFRNAFGLHASNAYNPQAELASPLFGVYLRIHEKSAAFHKGLSFSVQSPLETHILIFFRPKLSLSKFHRFPCIARRFLTHNAGCSV